MSKIPISTRPVNSSETVLRDKFAESSAGQSALMDKLAQQLIALELAIPGLYATVLKLAQGEDATIPVNSWLYWAFGCWFVALLLTLLSLIPRRWRVDPTILKQDPAYKGDVLGLEEFFFKSARYKWYLLITAALLFCAGNFCAALLVL